MSLIHFFLQNITTWQKLVSKLVVYNYVYLILYNAYETARLSRATMAPSEVKKREPLVVYLRCAGNCSELKKET